MSDAKNAPAEKPKPVDPNRKPVKDLPVNPRDMTPGRRGEYQTR